MQCVATTLNKSTPPQILPVTALPQSTLLQPPREQVAISTSAVASPPPDSPLLTPGEANPQLLPRLDARLQVRRRPNSYDRCRLQLNLPKESNKEIGEPTTKIAKATKAKSAPIKQHQILSAPLRLGCNGQKGRSRIAGYEFDGTSFNWLYTKVAEYPCLPPPSSYKSKCQCSQHVKLQK